MSRYLVQIGESLATVLEGALRAQPEHFAGYFANLDFWIAEFRHLRAGVDGFDQRFLQMKEASAEYLTAHGGRHNRDDACVPYQEVTKTTKKHDRNAVAARCKTALERWVERAFQLGLLRIERRDQLLTEIAKR
jgi:hypothetical protein